MRETDFVEHVVSALQLTDSTRATSVIELVLTLYVVRADMGYASTSEFVAALRQALESAKSTELPTEIDWPELQRRLTLLLALNDTVGVISKASYLVGEHQHVLHNAELFTDIRPVFRADPKQEPVGAIVTHNLKLTYHEGGDLKVLFLALSSDNVRTLRTLLERADHKAQSLHAFLDSHSLPILGEGR